MTALFQGWDAQKLRVWRSEFSVNLFGRVGLRGSIGIADMSLPRHAFVRSRRVGSRLGWIMLVGADR